MNRFSPFLSSVAVLTIASPLYAQAKSLPSAPALLQSAYSAYDKSKTLQIRIQAQSKNGDGKSENTEMVVAVENDSQGKIHRARLTMKQAPVSGGVVAKPVERQQLEIGDESFLILPLEKKYAPQKRETRQFSDFFRSVLSSVIDDKTKYVVAETKVNNVPVYKITMGAANGLGAEVVLEKESRLIRRVLLTFHKTEVVGDIKVESQVQNATIPEAMFAKPGADYTLDPAIAKDTPDAG